MEQPCPSQGFANHDFGGGPHAELRVVESVLAAGSTHTLRVTYMLGPPQASTAGSYQPAMPWMVLCTEPQSQRDRVPLPGNV
jgi:hypothetical protein